MRPYQLKFDKSWSRNNYALVFKQSKTMTISTDWQGST